MARKHLSREADSYRMVSSSPYSRHKKRTRTGAQVGFTYGMVVSTSKRHSPAHRAFVTGLTTAAGYSVGAGIHKRKERNMAKKGSWANGKSPAQGGTKHKMSKPEVSKAGLKGKFTKGKRTAKRKGTS